MNEISELKERSNVLKVDEEEEWKFDVMLLERLWAGVLSCTDGNMNSNFIQFARFFIDSYKHCFEIGRFC